MDNLGFIGFTLSATGGLFVGYAAIMVHHRFRKEHKVDDRVFAIMKRESFLGVLGLILIAVGYFLEIPGKF